VVTDVIVCLPFFRIVTVEARPVVVIAALGSSSTFAFFETTTLTSAVMPSRTVLGGAIRSIVTSYVTTLLVTVEVGDTAVTLPVTVVLVSAASVTVAGWPTLILVASASAKPATTSSFFRFSIVTKPELLLDELVAAPPVLDAAPVLPVPLEELDEELPPTVSPTLALTAVTVPLIGARSTVSLTALASAVTVL